MKKYEIDWEQLKAFKQKSFPLNYGNLVPKFSGMKFNYMKKVYTNWR